MKLGEPHDSSNCDSSGYTGAVALIQSERCDAM